MELLSLGKHDIATTLSTTHSIINSKYGHIITSSHYLHSTPYCSLHHLRISHPFDRQIRSMQSEQFYISLLDSVKPFCVNTPRAIPFAHHDKLKAELNLLEEQQIIAPITTATEWCAPIVVTPKKNTDYIQMCVDLFHLNRYVCRERY